MNEEKKFHVHACCLKQAKAKSVLNLILSEGDGFDGSGFRFPLPFLESNKDLVKIKLREGKRLELKEICFPETCAKTNGLSQTLFRFLESYVKINGELKMKTNRTNHWT